MTQGSGPARRLCLGDTVQQMALWHGVAAGQEQAVHSKNVGHPVTPSLGTTKNRGSAGQLQSQYNTCEPLQPARGGATRLARLVSGDMLFL